LYPGLKKLPGGGIETKPGNYFRKQLTRYTALDGSANKTKDATYKFGPYFKGEELPINPFDDSNDVKTNHTETDITVRNSSGEKGWKFYTQTGVLIANDGSHDNL
jgi:hypothetical protein